MKWTEQAEREISRVPFFVRKRVRKKVEEEASVMGAHEVRLEHVDACRKSFLNNMEGEVKGYQVETCFGQGGCKNRAVAGEDLATKLEEILSSIPLKDFLKTRVKGPLKMHHEFRISIADCPNCCSRPQIVDIGLVGARRPSVTEEPCSGCRACVETCIEAALTFPPQGEKPVVDEQKCLSCGQCITACPTGTIREAKQGYRILIGGKLGRHPRLGKELKSLHSLEETMNIVKICLNHYLAHNREGERFGELLDREPLQP